MSRYDNSEDEAAAEAAMAMDAERERILSEQRAVQAQALLGGLLTTDAGKPWSDQSTASARQRAGIELFPRPVT